MGVGFCPYNWATFRHFFRGQPVGAAAGPVIAAIGAASSVDQSNKSRKQQREQGELQRKALAANQSQGEQDAVTPYRRRKPGRAGSRFAADDSNALLAASQVAPSGTLLGQ